MTTPPETRGIHHLGLTVPDLDQTRDFFTVVLGWQVIGEKPSYPAVFVSDGSVMVTLWQLLEPRESSAFDRRAQVGLHHAAFLVEHEEELEELHRRIAAAPGAEVEFAPELSGAGPAKHLMVYEPGGIRLEFLWPGPR